MGEEDISSISTSQIQDNTNIEVEAPVDDNDDDDDDDDDDRGFIWKRWLPANGRKNSFDAFLFLEFLIALDDMRMEYMPNEPRKMNPEADDWELLGLRFSNFMKTDIWDENSYDDDYDEEEEKGDNEKLLALGTGGENDDKNISKKKYKPKPTNKLIRTSDCYPIEKKEKDHRILGMQLLSMALQINSNIHKLDFRCLDPYPDAEMDSAGFDLLDNEAAKILAESFKTNTTIRSVNLGESLFDSEGYKAFVDALKINVSILFFTHFCFFLICYLFGFL